MPNPFQARILIRRKGAELHGSWLHEGSESLPFPLALPLASEEMEELRWYLETFVQFPGHGDRARARGIEAQMQEWGHRAFHALFGTADGDPIYRRLQVAVGEGQPALLTLSTIEPDVLGQPWELLRDQRGPLALQGIAMRRQLLDLQTVSAASATLPLRVLLVISRPRDTGFIDPRTSTAPVLEALERLPQGTVTVDSCAPPTLRRLQEMIGDARERQAPYHVVHFDGHGDFLPRTGQGVLAFEDEQGRTDLVKGTALGNILKDLKVPLVLLEACRGSQLSDRAVSGSVAPALLQSGVSSVIAFSHSVHVAATRLFVERFYQKLAVGRSVGQAFTEARLRLHEEPARWLHLGPGARTVDLQDWFIPQLYQVGDDLALFAPALEQPRPVAVSPQDLALSGFPPPPVDRFHGRALELLELEHAFRRQPAVVIHGGGGMGKTALVREAAHWWIRTGHFETAVFCSFEQKQGAERVVQLLGQALEGEEFSARREEEQWRLAVRLFHERRVLLVWDNFESTLPVFQQGQEPEAGVPDAPLEFSDEARREVQRLYQELTEGNPRGRLLVTCRPGDTLLPGIAKLSLGGLARPDSLHLLAAIADREGIDLDRPGYERHEVDGLLTMLADHPLSIALVAPHLRELTPAQIREEFGQLLERFTDPAAPEGRNRSLLASLEFSTNRLSAGARRLLPCLAWFQGGVFESVFLGFAELGAEAWSPIREELAATALLNVEEPGPYLRFHPTLPYAARPTDVPDQDTAQGRFVELYQIVGRTVDKILRSPNPAAGMGILAREEANVRSAMALAFRREEQEAGHRLAQILGKYLERAGRLRERAALAQWGQERLPAQAALDEATCVALLEHASTRFEQGAAGEAVQIIQGVLQRLHDEGLPDPGTTAFQIATALSDLGQIYTAAGRPDLAVEPLQRAISSFEQQGERKRASLASTLSDLANAWRHLGQLDQALAAVERAVDLCRQLEAWHGIAAGLAQIGTILTDQGRFAEAEACYAEAVPAARFAGDILLQGMCLYHLGHLQRRQWHNDRAIDLLQQALALFQRAGHPGREMSACNALGAAEMQRGQLDAAEAWHLRSRELAEQLGDRVGLASAAQDLGIVYQYRADQADDPATYLSWLRRAVASVQESLAIRLELQDQVGAALSYGQLGVLYRMLGDLDEAEASLHASLQIHEALGLTDVWKNYRDLAEVARARGDEEAAVHWQAKCDTKRAELDRLQRGGA
jgi:tetratricopeptide (TPR) repeat protein